MVSSVVRPRAMSPLHGVRVCLYFRDSIVDKGLPSVWITAYGTQGHIGIQP